MLNPNQLVDQYLEEQHTMLLATVADGQPSCCPVFYTHDADFNLYWASWTTRRHSQEIERNSLVGASIVVQDVVAKPTIGIQIRGSAGLVVPSIDNRPIIERYAGRFAMSQKWLDNFTAGMTKHQLYRLVPSFIKLRDEVNFPDNPEQTILDADILAD